MDSKEIFSQNIQPAINSYLETLGDNIKNITPLGFIFIGGVVFSPHELHTNANAKITFIFLDCSSYNLEGAARQIFCCNEANIPLYSFSTISNGSSLSFPYGSFVVFNRMNYGTGAATIVNAATTLSIRLLRVEIF